MNKRISFCLVLSTVSILLISQGNGLPVQKIAISGNKITKDFIILRELTFHEGDTIAVSDLDNQLNRSRENVLNTFLFNYVTITSNKNSSESIVINIIVEERWYTWPSVIFLYDDRNFSAWLKSKDFSKTKYGLSLDRFNAFGRRENFRISFLYGYETQFFVSYKNIALDQKRKHYLGFDIEISRQDEIIFDTQENKPVTFNNNYQTVFEREKYTLNYLFRPGIKDYHNFYLNYFKYKAADTLIKLNPDFIGNNINLLNCFTVDYVYSRDKRDIKAYPLQGSYFELLIGETISAPGSVDILSSTVINPSYYKFLRLSDNIYYAGGLNLKLSYTNTNSFLFSKSLGYRFNMHGFEYNTIEGQNFIILKNLIKLAVVNPRIKTIPIIPLEKFNKIHYALYFNMFTDFGYVSDKYSREDNDYANRILFSCGAGLDFVTYYDRTFRLEYSINGFGISGFYFHLTAPLNK